MRETRRMKVSERGEEESTRVKRRAAREEREIERGEGREMMAEGEREI